MQSDHFSHKSGLLWKEVCYKVCLCENGQRQSCRAFIAVGHSTLTGHAQMVGGGRPLLHEIVAKVVGAGGSVWPKISGRKGRSPLTILCVGNLNAMTFHID